MKRAFDVLFSLFMITTFIPVFLIISLIIKCDSPGPIFFYQFRVGKNHKPFLCYKFRTMCLDAESIGKVLAKEEKYKKQWSLNQKLPDDPRVTRFGYFLRRFALDELPQFWNVLKGDLSVVGPRPILDEQIRQYKEDVAKKILEVRPGITGLWQISGLSHLGYEERAQIEKVYVEKKSFLFDLTLILKTIPAVLFFKKD